MSSLQIIALAIGGVLLGFPGAGDMFLLALLAVVAVIPIAFLAKPGQQYRRPPQLVGTPAAPTETAAR